MLRRNQPSQADGAQARTYYRSQSLFPWLYVWDGQTWHVHATDGTWVQDESTLSKETRTQLKEISRAEGEALLAAGRANTAEVEPPFRLHFVPPWKAPMLYVRVMASLMVIAGAVVFNAKIENTSLNAPMSLQQSAIHVGGSLAAVLIVCVLGIRERRIQHRYKPWERRNPRRRW